jgi:hypothetical protein
LRRGGGFSKAALASVVVSALTTGYNSACISRDFDRGVQRRLDEPEFYGYIPEGLRGRIVFFCMIFSSATLLLVSRRSEQRATREERGAARR